VLKEHYSGPLKKLHKYLDKGDVENHDNWNEKQQDAKDRLIRDKVRNDQIQKHIDFKSGPQGIRDKVIRETVNEGHEWQKIKHQDAHKKDMTKYDEDVRLYHLNKVEDSNKVFEKQTTRKEDNKAYNKMEKEWAVGAKAKREANYDGTIPIQNDLTKLKNLRGVTIQGVKPTDVDDSKTDKDGKVYYPTFDKWVTWDNPLAWNTDLVNEHYPSPEYTEVQRLKLRYEIIHDNWRDFDLLKIVKGTKLKKHVIYDLVSCFGISMKFRMKDYTLAEIKWYIKENYNEIKAMWVNGVDGE
jgi:hypothetical protein